MKRPPEHVGHAGPTAAQERREAEQRDDDVLREPLLRRRPAAAVGLAGGAQVVHRHPGALMAAYQHVVHSAGFHSVSPGSSSL